MPEEKLKILQVNANRSSVVMDEVKAAVRHLDCHIVSCSEPNLAALGGLDYYLDSTGGAAILDVSGVLRTATVRRGRGFVLATTTKIAFLSGYFYPNTHIDEFKRMLDDISEEIRKEENKKVVVCGVLNAKNHAWSGDQTDRRGSALQDAVVEQDLVCINRPDCLTYSVPGRRKTFIYLCFVNAGACQVLGEWRLCDEVAMSDHKAIVVTFHVMRKDDKETRQRPGVSVKYLDLFREALVLETGKRTVGTPSQLSFMVGEIVEVLSKAARASS